jgi:RNA polymerase sigma-70 factor (ECF subfamily)
MDGAGAVSIGELLDERRFLLDLAYSMLGSSSETESVVDETYGRWYELSDTARMQITQPRSWLAKTAGGICLSRLSLPDGFGDAGSQAVPADGAQATVCPDASLREEEAPRVPGHWRPCALSALDCLSPAEQAPFVFNDVPGITPGTVTGTVGRTEPERAGLADRARQGLRVQLSRPTTPERHDGIARAVCQTCAKEDADLLASLLSPDATAFFDGGGKIRAPTRPVHGSRHVAHSLLTLLGRPPRTTLTTQSVNGRTGLIARYDRRVAAIISFDIADHHVAQVWAVLNPDKLHLWNRSAGCDAPVSGDSSAANPPAEPTWGT